MRSEVLVQPKCRINLGDLRQFIINLPPLAEQQEIVRRVEALFAFADRIEARLTEARAQVERLTPATLAKAFRGELVPQDPNDEPASALLERLLTAKKTEAARPRPEKAPHKRIMKTSTKESVRGAIRSMNERQIQLFGASGESRRRLRSA